MRKDREIEIALGGQLRIEVLQEGRVVECRPWEKNLILDQGLDMVATVVFNQLFAACCVGNGTDPTNIRPTATATASGTTLTASAATFSSADLDSDVRFDTGQYAKIQSVTDSTHVTLFSSITVTTPTAFTILRTNQAILDNEIKRTVNCSALPNANTVIDQQGVLVLQRTFIFSAETTQVTYSEVGFSNSATAGANLFSRVLLASPVTLQGPSGALGGQQLQVTYQLSVGFNFGQGAGIYVPGVTATTINVTGLPIISNIFAEVDATDFLGNLSVSVSPPSTARPGDNVTIAGSSQASYNGTWAVKSTAPLTDPTHGASSLMTLAVPWVSAATTMGTLAGAQTGKMFRPCRGIYWINSIGGSSAPPNTADVFLGYGEPSIAGIAWLGFDSAAFLGSNLVPVRPLQPETVACLLQPYSAGNWYIDKKASFLTQSSQPYWSFGYGDPDMTNQIETWTWDQLQALGVGASLVLTFRFSWTRNTY